jgi:hypothetical protein
MTKRMEMLACRAPKKDWRRPPTMLDCYRWQDITMTGCLVEE